MAKTRTTMVGSTLDERELEQLAAIKRHLGIKSTAGVIKILIKIIYEVVVLPKDGADAPVDSATLSTYKPYRPKLVSQMQLWGRKR